MGDLLSDFANDHLRDPGWLTLNLAYLVYTASSIFKEMLRLRITLLAATLLYMAFGAVEGIWSMILWNIPVGIIHAWRIWALLHERRSVDLDDESEAIRVLIYKSLDRVAFHQLWTAGDEQTHEDGDVLITEATQVDRLTMILEGAVRVEARGEHISELGQFRFVGEMGTLSGHDASASVIARGAVRTRSWKSEELNELLASNAETERAHLHAVGQDLVRKLS